MNANLLETALRGFVEDRLAAEGLGAIPVREKSSDEPLPEAGVQTLVVVAVDDVTHEVGPLWTVEASVQVQTATVMEQGEATGQTRRERDSAVQNAVFEAFTARNGDAPPGPLHLPELDAHFGAQQPGTVANGIFAENWRDIDDQQANKWVAELEVRIGATVDHATGVAPFVSFRNFASLAALEAAYPPGEENNGQYGMAGGLVYLSDGSAWENGVGGVITNPFALLLNGGEEWELNH